MAKADKNKYFVHVEISQNGQVLSSHRYPYGKEKRVVLTNKPKAELTAPFYPLKFDVEVLHITKDLVEVDLDSDWEGFTTYKGKIEDISKDKSTKYLHLLGKDDIGTFIHNDLRVIVKIKPLSDTKSEKIEALPKNLRSRLAQLYFNSREEKRVLLFSALCSFIICAGVYAGMMSRHDDTPKSLVDLEESYSLAFIDADHFQTIPEAMQEYLDRSKPIRSTYNFYKNYTKMMLGSLDSIPPYLFKNTASDYRKEIKNLENKVEVFKLKQREFIASSTQKNFETVFSMPSVKGMSYREKLTHIKSHIKSLHSSFRSDLGARVAVTNAFKEDKKYENTKSDDAIIKKRQGNKIPTRSEMKMYKQFDALSQKAKNIQSDIKNDDPIPNKNKPIYIASNASFLSALNNIDFKNLNKKLAYMNASTFQMRNSKKFQEPIIGTLSADKVEKVINSKKYEIQLCYEAALRRDSKINGVMNWSWMLSTKGVISDISLDRSNITDERMITCIRRKLSRWKFPRPKRGSVKIEFPFKFSTVKG